MAQDDVTTITETARDLAYRQLDAQLQAGNNFDAKTVGVLGFDGAALAAVLATRDLFTNWWGIPTAGIMLSAVLAVLAIVSQAWDVGPDAGEFYSNASAHSAAEANVALVSELTSTLEANDRRLHSKAEFFNMALAAALVTGTVSAILVMLR